MLIFNRYAPMDNGYMLFDKYRYKSLDFPPRDDDANLSEGFPTLPSFRDIQV